MNFLDSIKKDKLLLSVVVITFVILMWYLKAKNSSYSSIKTSFAKRNIANLQSLNKIYQINPIKDVDEYVDSENNYTLSEFYVLSSYRSYLVNSKSPNFSSLQVLGDILSTGVRYIELDVYNYSYKNKTIPIVCLGSETGNFHYTPRFPKSSDDTTTSSTPVSTPLDTETSCKTTVNPETIPDTESEASKLYITLQECIDLIDSVVFTNKNDYGFTPPMNITDPFILSLNLKVEKNYNTLDKIAEILGNTTNIIKRRLTEDNYNWSNFGNDNISSVPMNYLCGTSSKNLSKFVLFCTSDYNGTQIEGTKLSSWVNGIWKTENATLPYIKYCSSTKNLKKPKDLFSLEWNMKSFDITEMMLYSDRKTFINDTRNVLFRIYPKDDNNSVPRDIDCYNNFNNESLVTSDSLTSNNRSQIKKIKPYVLSKSGTTNYNPFIAWRLGCQFICMNIATIDKNLELYLKIFSDESKLSPENSSSTDNDSKVSLNAFALKPKQLRRLYIKAKAPAPPNCDLGYNEDTFPKDLTF